MVIVNENLQDELFYGLLWPKSVTQALITYLLTQKDVGHWVWDSNNGPAIMGAREYLNEAFHMDYTNIEVLGRVKKLRSRYGLFNMMISHSGVIWYREVNYIYASPQQWSDWREMYPMSRAYITQGEPLFDELKALFAHDDGPRNDPDDDDELIIIIDSDEDELPSLPYPIVHALPVYEHDVDVMPFQQDDPPADIVVISSDESNHSFHDYLDSDPDMEFSNDDNYYPFVDVDDMYVEVVNPVPTNSPIPSDSEMDSPHSYLPIPAESLFAMDEALGFIPYYLLREGFTTSDDKTD